MITSGINGIGTGKFIERVFQGLVLAGVLSGLAGCGGGHQMEVQTEVVPYTEEQSAAREQAKNAEYRLRTGDRVSVSFKFEPELDQERLLILPDGRLAMPGLDTPIPAAGRTLRELDASLTREFAADYKDPELSIIITDITDPEVYVLGEVERPGLYKLPADGVGVIQAVASAGGFSDHANKSQTVVLRATDEGFMIRSYDLSYLEYAGLQNMLYFDLQAYDIVYVPRSGLGDFAYLTSSIFGSALNVTRFFWDIYAIANLDKIDRIVR